MKHLNLIGRTDGWEDAPYSDECWGVTSVVLLRDVTRCIDMHDLAWTKKQWFKHYLIWAGGYYGRNYLTGRAERRSKKTDDYFNKINELKVPLYSVRAYPQVPTSIAYPFKEISEFFKTSLFVSTIDFAIAMAIYERFTSIDFYGFKMNVKSEYELQVPSFSFWLGVAKGLGIECKIHGESTLLKSKTGLIYGYNVKPGGE